MKKKLKPIRRKGYFSFINKQNIFRNLLKDSISKFNDHYRIDFDNSSYSDISGNFHFVLHDRPYRKHSLRTMDLFYRRSTHELTWTLSKSILPTSLNPGGKGITQTFGGCELHSVLVKSMIVDWFEKEKVRGYKFHVTFKTEFPLFDYDKTLHIESVGSTLAKDVIDDIFEKEKNPTELERFRQAFRSARHMCDCTLHCSVVSLATDKEIKDAGETMELEISNGIYNRLTPKVYLKKSKNWVKEYIKNIYLIFVWLRKNSIPGRVQ